MAGDLALLFRTLDLRLSLQSHAAHSQSLREPIPFLGLTNASL